MKLHYINYIKKYNRKLEMIKKQKEIKKSLILYLRILEN